MKSANRTYTMRDRADAVAATRARIARAAMDRFIVDAYDEVTIASVAAQAGVSHQTVLNHFESKEGLFLGAAEVFSADLLDLRERHNPHDPESAVAMLVDQYEATGDGNVRLVALEDRIDAIKAGLENARASHQQWLEATFAERLPRRAADRKRAIYALYAATDVFSWKLLRRDLGLSRRVTQQVMTDMVTAIVATWPTIPEEGTR